MERVPVRFPAPHRPSPERHPLPSDEALRYLFGFVQPGEVILIKAAEVGGDIYPYFPVVVRDDHGEALKDVQEVLRAIVAKGMTSYLKLNPFDVAKVEQHSGVQLPERWNGSNFYTARTRPKKGTWGHQQLSRITAVSGDNDTGRDGDADWRKAMPTEEAIRRFLELYIEYGNVLKPTLIQTARGYSPIWLLHQPVPFTRALEKELKGITAELRFRLRDSAGFVDEGVYSNVNPDIKAPECIHPKTGQEIVYYTVDDAPMYTLDELRDYFDPKKYFSSERPQPRVKPSSTGTGRQGPPMPRGVRMQRALASSNSFIRDADKLISAWGNDLSGKVYDFVLSYSWHLRKIMFMERLEGVPEDQKEQIKKDVLHDLIEAVLSVTRSCTHDTSVRKIKRLVKMEYTQAPRATRVLAHQWGITGAMVDELKLETIIPAYVRIDRERLRKEKGQAKESDTQEREEDLRALVLSGASSVEVKAAGYSEDQIKRMRKKMKAGGVAVPSRRRSPRKNGADSPQ